MKFDEVTGNVYAGVMNNLYENWFSNFPHDNEKCTGGSTELQYADDGTWKYR